MVLYCINDRDSRGESYEINSIINLSIEYEISFIIVITLCFSIECGEMEKYIRENLKEVRLCRILTEDYYNRVKVINVFLLCNLR